MAVVSPAEFARLFAGLDRETRLSFLDDLWTARGWETDVRDGRLRVTNDRTGESRTIQPVGGSREVAGDPDVVVAARRSARVRERVREAGARYLEPGDVRELALYGLDRGRADDLFRRYFDRPLDAPTPESDAPTADRRALLGVLLVGVVLVAAAAAGVPGLPTSTDGGADARTDANVTVTPVSVETTATPEPDRTPATLTTSLGGGLDPEALARRHVAALEGRSYGLVAEFRGSRDAGGRRWISGRQTVSAAGPRLYVRNVTGERLTGRNESRVVRFEEFADAEAVYRRTDASGGPSYQRFVLTENRTANEFARRTGVYVERYLSTTELTVEEVVVDDYLVYRIEATGTPTNLSPNQPGPNGGVLHPPFGNVTNYTAVAYVESTGIVFSLTVRYDVDGRPVAFDYELSGLDATRVEPSEWYEDARDEAGEITGPQGQ